MRTLTLIAFFLCTSFQSMAVNPPDHFPANPEKSLYADDGSIFSKLTFEEMVILNKREIREKIGRKPTFREWRGLKEIRCQYQKIRGMSAGDVRELDSLSGWAFNLSVILVTGTIGMILGIIALATPKRYREKRGKEMAVFAVVIGAIQIVGFLIYLIINDGYVI